MRMPRSQRITSGIPLLEHVLRRHQQVVERRREAALEQHRLAGRAHLGQQVVVLHVARADLDHVGDLDHVLDVAHVHQLGDDRQPGLLLRLLEQAQALHAEALEAVRRGPRLVGATAQHRRPVLGDDAGGLERLLAALNRARPGDQAEVVAADPAAVDVDHRALALLELRRGELVRLQDRDQVVDARRSPRARARRPCRGRRSPRSRSAARPSRGGPSSRPPRSARRRGRSAPPSPPLSSRSSCSGSPIAHCAGTTS